MKDKEIDLYLISASIAGLATRRRMKREAINGNRRGPPITMCGYKNHTGNTLVLQV
jgi:hypothetical protein